MIELLEKEVEFSKEFLIFPEPKKNENVMFHFYIKQHCCLGFCLEFYRFPSLCLNLLLTPPAFSGLPLTAPIAVPTCRHDNLCCSCSEPCTTPSCRHPPLSKQCGPWSSSWPSWMMPWATQSSLMVTLRGGWARDLRSLPAWLSLCSCLPAAVCSLWHWGRGKGIRRGEWRVAVTGWICFQKEFVSQEEKSPEFATPETNL